MNIKTNEKFIVKSNTILDMYNKKKLFSFPVIFPQKQINILIIKNIRLN